MYRASLGPPQVFSASLVMLFCVGCIFYVYFPPTLSWPSATQTANTYICTANSTSATANVERAQPAMSTNKDNANTKEEATIVLIWAWPFGSPFELRSCSLLHNITGCFLTDDRNQYAKAHGVMFHHKEVCLNLPNLLELPRPPRQKWVWMNMESPSNSQQLPGPDSLFNLTSSYRKDSDVWVPYGRLVERPNDDRHFKIPEKDKLVCWIVNNWDDSFLRVSYFNELSRHITVQTFGGHFGSYLSLEDYSEIVSSCKFYLSFENSVHKDYITEKLFNPMKLGTVPVVLGPPRENYEEFIPAGSFIHVDDFSTPQQLAEHLRHLDQNQEMYEQYFTWREDFVAERSDFGLEHACRICAHLKQHKGYRVFKNLNKWYWI